MQMEKIFHFNCKVRQSQKTDVYSRYCSAIFLKVTILFCCDFYNTLFIYSVTVLYTCFLYTGSCNNFYSLFYQPMLGGHMKF